MKILAEDFKAEGQKAIDSFRDKALSTEGWSLEEPNYEGVRVNVPGGWILMRLSLHDPVLPINIETEEDGLLGKIEGEIKEFLKDFDMAL